jgi:hypothetical protein
MNLDIPPENLVMFLTIVTAAGFLTSYICYQWHRNKKSDSLLESNEELQVAIKKQGIKVDSLSESNIELQETIKKQGIAVNKAIGLIAQSFDNDTE